MIRLKLDDEDDAVVVVGGACDILDDVVAGVVVVVVVVVLLDVRPRIRLSKPLNDDMFMNRLRPPPLGPGL